MRVTRTCLGLSSSFLLLHSSLGCAPLQPVSSPAPLWCPPPLTWTAGEPRPTRLEIANGTDRSLSVYLDECIGQVRLGYLSPGQTARFRLPDRLIPFNDQLHLHVGDVEARAQFGSFAVPIQKEWLLSLTIDANTPSAEKTYDPAAPPPEPFQGMDGFQTSPGRDISYASRWAEGTDAVLTWMCQMGEPGLSFSPAYTDAEKLPVTVRFDGSSSTTQADWSVAHGRTDNLLAPGALLGPLTREALASETVQISVVQAGKEGLHRFTLKGLREALGVLPCFGGIGS